MLFLLLMLLTACGQSAPTQGEGGSDSVTDSAWLFETEAVQNENELKVKLTVTNQQENQGTLDFSSGQLYELVLTNDQGEEVYRYSDGRMFTMALVQESFEPGESKTFEEVIALEEDLPAGTYTLDTQLIVMAVDGAEWTDQATFQNRLEIEISSKQ